MSSQEIMQTLRHRYPFLLVDKIVSRNSESFLVRKNVSFNEPYFLGHFPEEPIYPGALIIEFMAQSAGLFIRYADDGKRKGARGYLVAVNKVKFHKKVEPGDVLQCNVSVKGHLQAFYTFKCVVKNEDEEKVAEGEVVLALEQSSGEHYE
jgi:3-hydroxyacyl-[acyl-carrier-protein] dehydratase